MFNTSNLYEEHEIENILDVVGDFKEVQDNLIDYLQEIPEQMGYECISDIWINDKEQEVELELFYEEAFKQKEYIDVGFPLEWLTKYSPKEIANKILEKIGD